MRWYPEGDEVNILVLHGKNMVTTNVEEAGGERVLSFREISQDTIRYQPSTGFIRTSAQSETERKELARLFAVHLLRRPEFFEGADAHNLYTLEPINRLGAAFRMRTEWDHALRAVTLTEIQVDGSERRPDGKWRSSPWAFTMRDSTNAAAKLVEMLPDVDLRYARIVYVKFRFDFDLDGRVRTIVVKVKPEDRVSFRRDAFEAQIRSICVAMASASHALLRSLLRQSDRRPIGHLDGIDLDGANPRLIDRLLARGVLREIRRLDRVGDLAVAGESLGSWALSVDGDEADQEIDPRSLRQFEIDPSALATFIAGAGWYRGASRAGRPPTDFARTPRKGDRGDGRLSGVEPT